MSKILFLENRHQTRTWETVAAGLRTQGYRIAWMVFNHGFAPRAEDLHVIPYPRQRDLAPVDNRFQRILASDRQIRYYGQTSNHYAHYDRHIRAVLERVQPDLVIGESTQFCELLTIEACREMGILYIVPTTARYPSGRFLCLLYDTLEVVGGCGEVPCEEELRAFMQLLAQRAIVPDYMKQVASGKKNQFSKQRYCDWIYKAAQYYLGEKFCSPSPFRKLQQSKSVNRNFEAWNRISQSYGGEISKETKTRILFPLHMQPEASVDVWGRPYSDQPALIAQLAEAAGESAVIFVKPNPKPNCEMSKDMLETVNRLPNVVPLLSSISMQRIFSHADLIVTVTGTVALEAIFARKPCATLIRTRNNDMVGCRFLESPSQLRDAIAKLQAGTFPMHTEDEVACFARRLYADSWPGIIQDTFSTPEAATPENCELLVTAFIRQISSLLAHKPGLLIRHSFQHLR